MPEKTNFPATYFDRDTVLRLARWGEIFSWFVLGYAVFQTIVTLVVFLLQLIRGLQAFNGPTDLLQQVIWFFQPMPPAMLQFIIIQAIGKSLLIFMDVEDNLRRIARGKE